MRILLKLNKRLFLYLILAIIIVSIAFPSTNSFNLLNRETNVNLKTSGTIEHANKLWLENPTFEDPIEPTWFSTREGDLTDVNSSTNPGYVNYEILGESGFFSNVTGTPRATDWNEFNNSYFIQPDGTHEINQNGCEASHEFQETFDQSRNRPSVHWRRNMTMPLDMSDYIITNASISAIVNGSADTNLETPNDNLGVDGPGYFATYYDYARFYIKFSNLAYDNLYEVAYYQTVDLGSGNQSRQATGVIDYLNDTLINVIDESTLIFYLTKALEADSYNFGITLGIDIYCEDNYNSADLDNFYSLLIKSVNLTFSYEKKIDQLSSLSWGQEAQEINGTNVEILKSNLKFKYKISELWPDSISPNSEIRIYINNRQHSETIKLSNVNTTFQEAKEFGFDLFEITFSYEVINFSLQIFLADEFGLDHIISISIDDVFLEISYTETIIDSNPIPEPLIFTILLIVAIIAAASVGGYFIAYYKLLRFPKSVRKVRKFRSTLKRGQTPSTKITPRKEGFGLKYKKELTKTSKYLKGTPNELSVNINKTTKSSLNKQDLENKSQGGPQ